MGAVGDGRVLNIAHRGASSVAPPNTLSAVRKAYELGADGVEFDVRLSGDGVPVVIHDSTVLLPDGSNPRVADLTLEQLKAIDVGSQFDAAYRREQIPTLEELLTWAKDRLLLNLELKSTSALDTRLPAAAVAEVERLRLGSSVLISSFNPFALLQTKRLAPHLQLGMLASHAFPCQRLLMLLGSLLAVSAIHPEHTVIDRLYISRARRRRMQVQAWTVDEPAEMRRLIGLGVNGIITNLPQVLRALLQESLGPPDRPGRRGEASAQGPGAWFDNACATPVHLD
jgi:glycerophosphoryl diester phosphodiesterase